MTKLYEQQILKFWEEKDIYNKVKLKNKGKKSFVHVDGPPYPTGEIHVGHLRNWAIKDSVLRFRRFQGMDVYARDGYDVHGLPVETKVQKSLGFKHTNDLKEFGEENFVKECKKYVSSVIDSMTHRRRDYGLWMDRDFYHTSHPDYLSMSWQFFKKAHQKGLLYKDYRTVAWSPALETTLSDYEIKDEYTTLDDPSIYVKFKVEKSSSTTKYDEYLVIWTTTPWTLQSNLAIAMNGEFDYSKVLVNLNGKEEVLILATSLVEKCIKIFSKQNEIKLIKILETKKGAEYEGMKYVHIYLEETVSQKKFVKENHKHLTSVVLADYVTLGEGEDILEKLEKKGSYKHTLGQGTGDEEQENKEKIDISLQDGTGLVHIAPGHGFEDFDVGKKYNLPIFSPVDTKGYLTEGLAKGFYFREANEPVMKNLKERHILLFSKIKSHRYPCCWRSKVPIVYRATEQWYIKRSAMTEDIIKANSNVNWYPTFAKESFNHLMSGAGDWAISRQRFWGIPLPIFEDEDGNFEVFGSKEELEKRTGIKLNDIHRDDLKNLTITLKNGKIAKAVPYIADVWFDSGCASFASHYGEGLTYEQIIEKYYPMKWVTEGRDQIRGWFSSLFNVGYMLTEKAPYNEVLFQEFVMAKDGTKMSKSLGNGVEGVEALEKWGADRTRYYLLTKAVPENQINFDAEEFSNVEGFFNTLENLTKFMNSYLKEHKLEEKTIKLDFNNLDASDLWILYRLNKTIISYERNFENYRINLASRDIEDFILRDLSKTYLKLVKERTEERDESLLLIFSEILKKMLILIAPQVPFKAEELYLSLDISSKKESIFLEEMPLVNTALIKQVDSLKIDENFELASNIIAAVLNSREKIKTGVRWPLSQIDILSTEDLSLKLKPFENLIKKLSNIVNINYDAKNVDIEYSIKPNFATIKLDFKDVQNAIKTINSNKEKISKDLSLLRKAGVYGELEIDFDKHLIKEIVLKGELISSEFTGGTLILHTHQDEKLLSEGYLRETIRRVQQARKDLGLNKKDEIKLSFYGSDKYLIDIFLENKNLISKKVGAKNILNEKLKNIQEFEIKDKKLVISID